MDMSNTENTTQTVLVFPGNSTYHATNDGKTCICGKTSRRYHPMAVEATAEELAKFPACKSCY